jgi:integrase
VGCLRKEREKEDQWQNRYMMSHALKQFKRYCKKAGIETDKKLNLHCLRKGYGTNLVNIGTPANTLQELMGHSSVITSMKFYVNSIDENKKKAVEGLDRLMG